MSEQTAQETARGARADDADPPEGEVEAALAQADEEVLAADGAPVDDEVLVEDALEAARTERAEKLTTQPKADDGIAVPSLGLVGMGRWMWRQLTSMRIALVLLFMLSLAAIPGSILPQREINPTQVLTFYQSHPAWAPILNDLQLFDVFESVWFGAIYGLLFISLIGCIVPRSWAHFKMMRAAPPAAPRNLKRLPVHASFTTTTADEDEVLALAPQAAQEPPVQGRAAAPTAPAAGSRRRRATCARPGT